MNKLSIIIRYICLIIGTVAIVSCIMLSRTWLTIACITLIAILIMMHYIIFRKHDSDNFFSKVKEGRRKEILLATVIEINRGVDKEFRPYEQLICEYSTLKGKKIIFKGEQVLGKSDIMIGNLCKVSYEKGNYKNYMVVPFQADLVNF